MSSTSRFLSAISTYGYLAPTSASSAYVGTRGYVLTDPEAWLFTENSPAASGAFWGAAAGAMKGEKLEDVANDSYFTKAPEPITSRPKSYFVDDAVKNILPFIDGVRPETGPVFQLFSHGRPGELFIEGEWKDA